jgi:hypothetical protein
MDNTNIDNTNIDNEIAKLETFIDTPAEVAGLKLRPMTAGSLILLRMTKNGLLDGGEDIPDIEYQVLSFLYIHSGDAAEVRKSVKNIEVFEDKVLQFADTLSIKDFVKAADQVKQIITESSIGADYTIQDTGDSKKNQ